MRTRRVKLPPSTGRVWESRAQGVFGPKLGGPKLFMTQDYACPLNDGKAWGEKALL